ncbi:MAG: hypothetical protein LBR07_07715 [Puniceicoccales bacterium]|nr:hypothetical protein [Puniceicoccales bacterium]
MSETTSTNLNANATANAAANAGEFENDASGLDARLDAFLRSRPLTAPDGFADAVLRAAKTAPARTDGAEWPAPVTPAANIIRFARRAAALAAALAAILALPVFLFLRENTGTGGGTTANPSVASSEFAPEKLLEQAFADDPALAQIATADAPAGNAQNQLAASAAALDPDTAEAVAVLDDNALGWLEDLTLNVR